MRIHKKIPFLDLLTDSSCNNKFTSSHYKKNIALRNPLVAPDKVLSLSQIELFNI